VVNQTAEEGAWRQFCQKLDNTPEKHLQTPKTRLGNQAIYYDDAKKTHLATAKTVKFWIMPIVA